VGVLSAQPYRPIMFVGVSMEPTYADREIALATTEIGEIHRGDVVVIKGEAGDFVKRVAYIPGDKIEYHYFAGEWLFGNQRAFDRVKRQGRFPSKTVVVPDGYVFVLGDNWNASVDSRQLGMLPMDSIKAVLTSSKPFEGAN
jgi:signal peptidase I